MVNHLKAIIRYSSLIAAFVFIPASAQVNGLIIRQQVDNSGNGYSVLKVWGTYTQMGYAQGYLYGQKIESMIASTKTYIGATAFNGFKTSIGATQFQPADVLDEIDGIVAGMKAANASSTIDAGDIKVMSTFGDWSASPACRSHTCWGSYVQAPIKTLSSRRLDYTTPPMMTFIHHALVARNPSDGTKVKWVSLGFPGMPSVATAVNEYGTICSLHDYQTSGTHATGTNVFTRSFATRYALTMNDLPSDPTLQLSHVYQALQPYKCWTGTFINYYIPEGKGGVITCNQTQGFYNLRVPQAEYYGGEVMVTSNAQTDGKSTPSDAAFFTAYYNGSKPKTLADHWTMLQGTGTQLGFHQMSIAYRGKGDMTIWFDGRLQGSTHTARVEIEWSELFGATATAAPLTMSAKPLQKTSPIKIGKDGTVNAVYSSKGSFAPYSITGKKISHVLFPIQ